MSGKNLFVVKRKLGAAQYGDILLCEIPMEDKQLLSPTSGSTSASESAVESSEVAQHEEPQDSNVLFAVKRVFLEQFEARQKEVISNTTTTIGGGYEDPTKELEYAERILEAGGHENVLRLETAFVEGDCLMIVMEYCNQGDLFQHLDMAENKRFPEEDALAIFSHVVSGVGFLHHIGIAHRDLSLENVLVKDGVCKISDFGLSTDTETKSCESVGKSYYMAPEVVAGEWYDPVRADVWSLGILLFIMLTGSPLVDLASVENRAFGAFKKMGVKVVLEKWGLAHGMRQSTLDLLDQMLQTDPSKRLTVSEIACHPAMAEYMRTEKEVP